MEQEDLEFLITEFLKRTLEPCPIGKDEYILVLERMQNVGLLSKTSCDNFIKRKFNAK
jgi:hypothetical protein